jgi:preprotein translocase subunit SecB
MSQNSGANDGDGKPVFNIQRLYTKEISCKIPNAPQIFRDELKPEISTEVQIKHEKLQDEIYEVVLKIHLTGKSNNITAFTIEVHQAGIFDLKAFDNHQLDQLLRGYCPNILFPYIRRVISDVMNDASLPPFILNPINFEALYLQQQQAKQTDAKEAEVVH